ncbi:hypothetical protein ACLOJK_024250, partial [Asimina triloba]
DDEALDSLKVLADGELLVKAASCRDGDAIAMLDEVGFNPSGFGLLPDAINSIGGSEYSHGDLEKYEANVNCKTKQVTLKTQDKTGFIFNGVPKGTVPKLVSALKAMSLVRKACVVFLASVVDGCPESRPLEEIAVVKEFSD